MNKGYERPWNFLGVKEMAVKDAEVVVLPVPYEKTVCYGEGTKNGPHAIIDASRQLEFYDEEFGDDLYEFVKIKTEKPTKADLKSIETASAKYTDKFLISLGGEHSITPALVAPWVKKYPDLSILQIDAHTDMRDIYEGSRQSHACAMRRSQDAGVKNIVQVGIRSTSKEEQPFLNKKNIFWEDRFTIDQVLSKLGKNVYISFDVDGLDPSIMPSTGTPEPGGLSYFQALDLMRAVLRKKNVVAMDFVELMPIKNLHAYDFLVAKLIYKSIAYKFIPKLKKF